MVPAVLQAVARETRVKGYQLRVPPGRSRAARRTDSTFVLLVNRPLQSKLGTLGNSLLSRTPGVQDMQAVVTVDGIDGSRSLAGE